MKLAMFIVAFLLIGAFFIISNQNLALGNVGSREVFFEEYSDWLADLADNSGSIVGYVVKMEWLPEGG